MRNGESKIEWVAMRKGVAYLAKIPRTRRWRVTAYGRRVMGTALYLRKHDFSRAYSRAAAA